MRITAQATRKDKINVHWDEQHPCNGSTIGTDEDGCRNQPESGSVYGPLGLGGLSSTTSPEIGGYLNAHPRVRQVTWSETATNRMLFEAGVGLYQAPFGPYEAPGNLTRPLARMTEQCAGAAGCPLNGGIPWPGALLIVSCCSRCSCGLRPCFVVFVLLPLLLVRRLSPTTVLPRAVHRRHTVSATSGVMSGGASQSVRRFWRIFSACSSHQYECSRIRPVARCPACTA